MNLAGFLSDLQQLGVRISTDGDRLHCRAPAGALTPELLAALRERKGEILTFLGAARAIAGQPAIIPLQPHGTGPAVFAVAGHNGDVFAYLEMARALGADQPFFGLQPPGVAQGSVFLPAVEPLAAYFADQIAALSPRGPQILAGYCAGGTIAFELARQLTNRGIEIGFIVMFGCPFPHAYRWLPRMGRRVRTHLAAMAALETIADRARYVRDFAGRNAPWHRPAALHPVEHDPMLERQRALEAITLAAVRQYTPPKLPATLHLFLPNRSWRQGFQTRRWHAVAGDVHEHVGPDECAMETMLRPPYQLVFADFFREAREAFSARAGAIGRDRPAPYGSGGLAFSARP